MVQFLDDRSAILIMNNVAKNDQNIDRTAFIVVNVYFPLFQYSL